jgi:hypothetical protein
MSLCTSSINPSTLTTIYDSNELFVTSVYHIPHSLSLSLILPIIIIPYRIITKQQHAVYFSFRIFFFPFTGLVEFNQKSINSGGRCFFLLVVSKTTKVHI